MKTPDAIGGTDAQQQEYAAKVRIDDVSDEKEEETDGD